MLLVPHFRQFLAWQSGYSMYLQSPNCNICVYIMYTYCTRAAMLTHRDNCQQSTQPAKLARLSVSNLCVITRLQLAYSYFLTFTMPAKVCG